MVDGVLLVVDAYEGPMPQTRFVLQKALELNLKVVVVINKIDKKDARVSEVRDEVLELFMDLDATDEQLDSPFVYASARNGISSTDENDIKDNFVPLFETILSHIPAPSGDATKPFNMLISSTEQNDFLGKLAVGKIENGTISVNNPITVTNHFNEEKSFQYKVQNLFVFDGLKRIPVKSASAGEIVCIAGSSDVTIGDSLSDPANVNTIPFVKISEPSVEMVFSVNNSPFAGKEGKFCTSRHLRDRLQKEAIKDLSLKVLDTESADSFRVLGRGEMHISILIENMRRDGYEMQVSMPRVLIKEIDGKKYEPIEQVFVDVPENCAGSVITALSSRKGELTDLQTKNGRSKLTFLMPARGLFGYKSQFLTETRGEGIMNTTFYDYQPYKGAINKRNVGALVAYEQGEAVQYGLFYIQERGRLIVVPGDKVYGGMVVGFNPKGDDIIVNVCKKKHLTNTRSSSSDEALRLEPVKKPTPEEFMEYLDEDELLEITPLSLRMRKTILDHTTRGRMDYKRKQES